MSGGVFREVLSICYNRTDTFLVAGIYLIKYDRGFVILLVNLLVRLTCISLFCPLFFIPCDWSCSTLWMYLLLGVDVVCHCSCSPCCDLCAAAWATVLYTVFVGVVFWCPYFFLYVLPSLRGMFHYCLEYRVALYGKSVVYLVPVFGFSVNVKFSNGVEHFSLSLIVNYVQYFVHWAEGVPFVYNMLGECGSVV